MYWKLFNLSWMLMIVFFLLAISCFLILGNMELGYLFFALEVICVIGIKAFGYLDEKASGY